MRRKYIFRRLLPLLMLVLTLALCACGDKPDQISDSPGPSAVTTAPKASPSPSPTAPESTPGPEPEEPRELYEVRLDSTAYRAGPDISLEPIGTLGKSDVVEYLDEDGDFVQVRLDDGQEAWIHGWFLAAKDEQTQKRREDAFLENLTSAEGFQSAQEIGADGKTFTCMANLLNCRSGPTLDSTVLYQISFGTELAVLGIDNGFYLCRLKDGGLVYCYEGYLTSEATYVQLDGAVDLRAYMPTGDFEILFASSNNIVGEAMYPAIPLLEESTAQKLLEAQEIFRAAGYSIKIYDAYRPKSAQYQLYDIVQDSRFIASPYNGRSWHQIGRAIDMSLIDMATGQELEMPTPMHTFDTSASRYNSGSWSESARANSDYMTEVMTSVGFKTIATEWWHFQYEGPGGYMDENIDFSTLTYVPISELIADG